MSDIAVTVEDGETIAAVVTDPAPILYVEVAEQGLPGPPGDPGTGGVPLDYLDFTLDPVDPVIPGVGRLHWDAAAGTLSLGLEGGAVNLQIGQEQVMKVVNRTGSTLADGTLVIVSGATGQTPEVSLPSAMSFDQSIATIGMVTEPILNNAIGFVTTHGNVHGLNTDGIPEGTVLYLSDIAGQFVASIPAYPSNQVMVGVCLYEHAVNGKIFVYPRLIPRKFGNPDVGHFTGFNDDGFMEMHGNARVFRDELGDALSLKVQGVGITTNSIELVVEFPNTADLNDYLYKNVQLNHDRDSTTAIFPHLHFFQENNAVPNFLLQYRWQINGTQKVTPWTNLRCNVAVLPYVSGSMSQIASTLDGIAPPAESGLSDIIQFKMIRDSANASGEFVGADPYAGTVGVTSFDVHILLNTLGSDEIMSKY